ncbi:MAG: CRISPR-associated endonuclease Cas2 [Tissierellia bacterium]|nr:CRISPR-associated endonuclease Cas2 [Tissierellia bacterium]
MRKRKYDRKDNIRRNKFFKYLSGYANPVQKSCFESYLSEKDFEKMKSKIEYHTDKEMDNVRIYKLSAYGEVYNFGLYNENNIEKIVII